MPNNLKLPKTPKGLQKGLAMLKKVKLPEKVLQKIPSVKLPELQELRKRTREMVGRRGSRTKPTDYPFLVFHGIRSLQLLAAIVVMSIMWYFLASLQKDGFSAPWTFILLLTVSVLTILMLSATVVLHCYFGLNPKMNLVLNGGLLALWTLGFALLTWWASGTLGHICTIQRWQNNTGVSVCRSYKALFAFALFGFLSTTAAAILDLYVSRRTKAKGIYDQMADLPDVDRKQDPLPNPDEFPEHNSQEMQPVESAFEPSRSPKKPRSIKDVPRADSLRDGSPYDVFKPDVVVPAPKSSTSSSKRPSRDGYEPIASESHELPSERVLHAETRPQDASTVVS